jgi:capsule polysaccharide export protein KpsE/RkpR
MPIFVILAKKKFFIFSTVFIATGLMVVLLTLSFFLPSFNPWNMFPDTYESRVKIMVTWEGMTEIQQNMGMTNPLEAASNLATLPIQNNPYIELLSQLLHGNAILDKLAEEFNLYNEISPKKASVRDWIRSRLKINSSTQVPLPTFYIIEISFIYANQEKCLAFLKRSIQLLQERFSIITSASLNEKKIVIAERITGIEQELSEYLNQIKMFKEKYGFIDIRVQGEKQLQVIADNSVKILEKQLEIQQLRKFLSADSPRIRAIQEQIDAIVQFMGNLKSKSTTNFSPLNEIPDLEKSYEEIQQNYNIQLAILNKLKYEHEKIKIDNINYLKNFLIIEEPELPESPVGPNRIFILIKVIIGALVVAVLWVILKAYLLKLKYNIQEAQVPSEEEQTEEANKLPDKELMN